MIASTPRRAPAPPTSLRERKKERTKSTMIEAALRLFAAQGYDNVTVQDIADEAEVSATTFFRYFATKEEVLFTDARDVSLLLADVATTAKAELDDIGVVHHIARTVFGEHFNADHVRARYMIAVGTPELRGRISDSDRRWREAFLHLLQQRHQQPVPSRELQLTARVGTTVLRAAMDEWTSDASVTPTRDQLLALIDQWFDEWRASSLRWTSSG